MNQDPLGLKGGLNLYRYSRNNPLVYFDPSGQNALGCTLAGALIGVSIIYGGAFAFGIYEGGTWLAGYLAADAALAGNAGLYGLGLGAAAGLGFSISPSSGDTYSLGDFDYGEGEYGDNPDYNFGSWLNDAPGSPSLGANTDFGSSDFSSGDGS